MCETNENKCECNAKEICCKMQKASSRKAIAGLKSNQICSNTILKILKAIYNILLVYKCLPGSCLLERVNWVYDHIVAGNGELYKSERVNLNMLIAELEVFCDS